MLRDNVEPGGNLDIDRFLRAVMQYRNTPMQDSVRSPAQMVFGRQMRDFLRSLPHKYEPTKDWAITQEYREQILAKTRDSDDRKWRESLIGRCRLHGKLNMVCCRVPFRSHTWAEVQARTDTLVRQPPYLVTRGWEEVVPWGD